MIAPHTLRPHDDPMATNDRASSLVDRVIAHLKRRPTSQGVVGASSMALDKLESKLMVELPPSLRTFLQFDFTFASLGPKFHARARFGQNPESPRPRISSVRKLAEAKTDLGWTESRIKGTVSSKPLLIRMWPPGVVIR